MNRAWIPNSLTLGNLFCGLGAIASLLVYSPADAFSLVPGEAPFVGFLLVALVLDVFDGWTARQLGVAGPLGLQLDSLADAVTFGVAPAVGLFATLLQHDPGSAWMDSSSTPS
jgi:CDP-diacylglycerol--serine O-phosphatidyltransferase